jgi:hypothetical protein
MIRFTVVGCDASARRLRDVVRQLQVRLICFHQIAFELCCVVGAVDALVEELAGMFVGLQHVFPQVFLSPLPQLAKVKIKIHVTHRVVASIIAVRAFVDLSLVHLVHPHVPPQMTRQLRLVLAVFARKFEFQFLMFARMAG